MARMRDASAVILWRGDGPDREVFVVERNPALRFFGGYWALPGGVVDDEDEGDGSVLARHACCASRELAEETEVALDPAALQHVLCLTTPDFVPVRYRTHFFAARLPEGALPRVQPGELMRGEFVRPADLLARWTRGERLVVPPVLLLLELLAGAREWDDFVAAARAHERALEQGRLHSIRFTPGIFVAPLRTPTLPPATTTNCLLVGHRRVFVVDPATPDPAEQARLFERLDELRGEGCELAAVLVTHHHRDHVGAVDVVSRRYRLPVWGHPRTLERLPETPSRAVPLVDGDRVELGDAPDGTPDWHLDVLHTPGHDQGHLAFRESRLGAVLAGDMVSTLSSIIIDPPEGHLATYLKSLERLLALPAAMIYPAHGPAFRDSRALLRHYLRHRKEREEALVAALQDGVARPRELVATVYQDVDPGLHSFAERSLLAGLEKLAEEGRAVLRGDRWGLR